MKFFQILGVVFITILLGLFALYVFVDKRAPSYISSVLKNSGFENAQIGSFEYGFSGFSLKNIRLDKDGLSKIGEIKGRYSLTALIRGKREVENIKMSDIHLQGTLTEDKTISIVGYGVIFKITNDKKDKEFKISLPVLPFANLDIEDAIIDFSTPYGELKFFAEGNLSRKKQNMYGGQINLRTKQKQLTFDTKTIVSLNPVEDSLTFKIQLDDAQLEIPDIDFSGLNGALNIAVSENHLSYEGNFKAKRARYKTYEAQDIQIKADSSDEKYQLRLTASPPNDNIVKIGVFANKEGLILQSDKITFNQLADIGDGITLPQWMESCKPIKARAELSFANDGGQESPFSFNMKTLTTDMEFSGTGTFQDEMISVSFKKESYPIGNIKKFCDFPALASIEKGVLNANGKMNISLDKDALSINGPLDISLTNISGKVQDYNFDELRGNIALKQIFPTLEGYSSNMRIKSIEKDKIALTDTNFKLALNGKTATPQITLSDVDTHLWDGNLSTKKVNLSSNGQITSPVKLQFSNFELGKLLDLLKIKGLQAKGIFSGYITLAQSEKGLVISEGQLNNEENGYIKYAPETYPRALQGDDPRMNTVRGALTNFTFDELKTNISGPLDGDLTVVLNAKGKNKALFEDRPVHLNLSIEGALSPLLKSFLKPLSLKPTLNDNKESE